MTVAYRLTVIHGGIPVVTIIVKTIVWPVQPVLLTWDVT